MDELPIMSAPSMVVGSDPPPLPERWGRLEVLGHRRHYGRISIVEEIDMKWIVVEVPTAPGTYDKHQYPGGSIFGLHELSKDVVMACLIDDGTYEAEREESISDLVERVEIKTFTTEAGERASSYRTL